MTSETKWIAPESRTIARLVVHEFGGLSYNAAFWEKLVGDRSFCTHGCLMDILGFSGSVDDREQITFYAAQALRVAFPQFTNSRKNWLSKVWDDNVADNIIDVVFHATQLSGHGRTKDDEEVEEVVFELSAQPNGFVPWRPFLGRTPVSSQPGVYLLAVFENRPAVDAEPLDHNVIYIGIAEGQSTGARLQQFEQTALGKTGHSGGFTFRTELVPLIYQNDLSQLRRFKNLYCSWREMPSESPRPLEEQLLRDYVGKWGQWPKLNKKG